ncbi:hypothetical protein FCULG_00011737 [Fusarium culmorum]|uniref:Uncharacterized protein n=1 Tax=Fusarium culmorum TaxID=5516 RepID=A0A2T4GRZ7_FUSCU|nr:hypothetical protein FCULG_00011737 [Fusarium culmorum]
MELLFCCHVAESGPRNITNQRGTVTQLMEGSDPRHSTDYTHSTIHAAMTSQLVQCLTPVIEYTSLFSYTKRQVDSTSIIFHVSKSKAPTNIHTLSLLFGGLRFRTGITLRPLLIGELFL